jgi:hypothetical protein
MNDNGYIHVLGGHNETIVLNREYRTIPIHEIWDGDRWLPNCTPPLMWRQRPAIVAYGTSMIVLCGNTFLLPISLLSPLL